MELNPKQINEFTKATSSELEELSWVEVEVEVGPGVFVNRKTRRFGSNVILESVSNETEIDLELGDSFKQTADENTELKLPLIDRAQKNQLLVLNSGGITYSFQTGYIVLGDTPTTVDGESFLAKISCFGNGRPIVIIYNLGVISIEGYTEQFTGEEIKTFNNDRIKLFQ